MTLPAASPESSTATSTSEQAPALAKRKSATGSLYDATRSQARHSATTAGSSSATALFTVSNIRALPSYTTSMFACRETARNDVGGSVLSPPGITAGFHPLRALQPQTAT